MLFFSGFKCQLRGTVPPCKVLFTRGLLTIDLVFKGDACMQQCSLRSIPLVCPVGSLAYPAKVSALTSCPDVWWPHGFCGSRYRAKSNFCDLLRGPDSIALARRRNHKSSCFQHFSISIYQYLFQPYLHALLTPASQMHVNAPAFRMHWSRHLGLTAHQTIC